MSSTSRTGSTLLLAQTTAGAERAARWVRGDAIVIVGSDVSQPVDRQALVDVVIDVPDADPGWLHSALDASRGAVSPGGRLLLVLAAPGDPQREIGDVMGEALHGLTVNVVSTNRDSVALSMGPAAHDDSGRDRVRHSLAGAFRLASVLKGLSDSQSVDIETFETDLHQLTGDLGDLSGLHRELALSRRELDALRANVGASSDGAAEAPGRRGVETSRTSVWRERRRVRKLVAGGGAAAGWVVLSAVLVAVTSMDLDALPGLLALGVLAIGLFDARRRSVSVHRRIAYTTRVAEETRSRLGEQRAVADERHSTLKTLTHRAANATERANTIAKEAAVDNARRYESHRASLDRVHAELSAAAETHSSELGQHPKERASAVSMIRGAVEQELMTLYRQIEANQILRDAVHVTGPTPPLRGWAASPDVLALLVVELQRVRPTTIVECGSGASTAWLAMACRTLGLDARVVSLEHEDRFAIQTRELVAACGVEDLVEVRCAPLVELVSLDDFEGSWYSPDLLDDVHDIGLVFVDGPPADTNALARFPALPMLYPRLAATATIVLDDTIRKEERVIAERWMAWADDLVQADYPLEKGAAVFRRMVPRDHSRRIVPVPPSEVLMPDLTKRLRNRAAAWARRLPPPRDEAALAALRALKALLTNTPPRPAAATAAEPLPAVERIHPDDPWTEPPVSDKTGTNLAASIYKTGSKPDRYDVALLEALNEEYRDRPLVPAPRAWTSQSLGAAARRRVEWAHNMIDLRDKTVLEVGCGNGYEAWTLAHNLGCDAYGVDVIQPNCWEDLVGDRVHLQCIDLTLDNPFPPNKFDRIISYTTWEHVAHPYKLLEETFEILKPGGFNWIRANLWAGPQASHRYREIFFPWPHLLFSDDVIREWDAKHGRTTDGAAWVNKLTWNHYERYIENIGYRLRQLQFQHADWDEEFYLRFEDKLGRIPRTDLARDYFLAVLEKPEHA